MCTTHKLRKTITVYTLEYDCTDTLDPRFTGIFKANLTDADILPIDHRLQTYSIYFGWIPHVVMIILSISFGGLFDVGISMSNEDTVRTCWLRSADI